MVRRLLMVLAVLLGVCTSGLAMAQEIQLTGPLAGAPAVRKLRLRRQGRVEIAPTVGFTLLDEYRRTIFIGGKLDYNVTDWLGIGVWGAAGAVKTSTYLSDQINDVTQTRRAETNPNADINNTLTKASIHPTDFRKQLGSLDWVVAPQLTLVPFRGKLAIFQKIFVDTDAFIFGGPAFVGVTERQNCSTNCETSFGTKSRTAITGTFGAGLTFYMSQWASLGVDWRALPLAWNTGGFDNHGGGPEGRFPDLKIDEKDREFHMNMQIGITLGFQLPARIKNSD